MPPLPAQTPAIGQSSVGLPTQGASALDSPNPVYHPLGTLPKEDLATDMQNESDIFIHLTGNANTQITYALTHNTRWSGKATTREVEEYRSSGRSAIPVFAPEFIDSPPEQLFITFSELFKWPYVQDWEKNTITGLIFGTSPDACHILLGYRGTPGVSARQFAISIDDKLRIVLRDCGSSFGTLVQCDGRPIQLVGVHAPLILADCPGSNPLFEEIVIHAGRLAIGVRMPNHYRASTPSYIENLQTLVGVFETMRSQKVAKPIMHTTSSNPENLRDVRHCFACIDQQVRASAPASHGSVPDRGALDIVYRSGRSTDTYRQKSVNGINFTVRLSDGWIDSLEILRLARLDDGDRKRYRDFLAKYVRSTESKQTKNRVWVNFTDARLIIEDLGLSALLGDVIAEAARFSKPDDLCISEALWIKTTYKSMEFGNHRLSVALSDRQINATHIYKAAERSTDCGHLGTVLRRRDILFERLSKGPIEHRGLYVEADQGIILCRELDLPEIAYKLLDLFDIATTLREFSAARSVSALLSVAEAERISGSTSSSGNGARRQDSTELHTSHCAESNYGRRHLYLPTMETSMLVAHVPLAEGTSTISYNGGEEFSTLSDMYPDLLM
ncbi:hypothetical protein LTR17_019976 [Elasticomyces elasticus]|nr:hypothetical protein LTR17_019976 [Elasticomyces elasticus]